MEKTGASDWTGFTYGPCGRGSVLTVEQRRETTNGDGPRESAEVGAESIRELLKSFS